MKMFTLDLAGHKQWKQCATMQEGRHHFGAGVLDGKIYVVGGCSMRQFVSKCEVYDPKVDAWSSIADLIPVQVEVQVASIGGEIFVYGGMNCSENPTRQHFSHYADAYNPVKNEWRQLGHFNGDEDKNPWVHAFVAQGKFQTITLMGINVYDMDTNSWSILHSLPYPRSLYHLLNTWALDDEILILREARHTRTLPGCLVQSGGFGKNREITLKAVGNCRLRCDLERLSNSFQEYDMYLIQL